MISFDFDSKIQDVFIRNYSNIKDSVWKTWLDINSPEEYEELILKSTGLSVIEDFSTKVLHHETLSRDFAIDVEDYIETYKGKDPLILCHTSGTTDSNLSRLKWFHMTRNVIEKLWAPGMKAIFESSGLNSKSTAIIFVPSRMKIDGINKMGAKDYYSLYSSEFSQRIMLAVIKPESYLFYEYKRSTDLHVISEILSLDKVAVISAPSATILKWADIGKLEIGIKNSLKSMKPGLNKKLDGLLNLIQNEGIEKAIKMIQLQLSDVLSKAVLVFSISSLSENQWNQIRTFMQWKKGEEKFTNLYVASEIGPFAASIGLEDFEVSRKGNLYVFPLTIPTIDHNGEKELICYTNQKIGELFVSRMHDTEPLFNINTGDVVRIENQEGLPQINGKIIRSGFNLKYPINISEKVKTPQNYDIYAGDFFSFKELNIIEPRSLLNCLEQSCDIRIDTMLLVKDGGKEHQFKLILPIFSKSPCSESEKYLKFITNCPNPKDLITAIKNRYIDLEFIDEQPVEFFKNRSKMLSKVREGKIPKGILKKWPLYIVIPKDD